MWQLKSGLKRFFSNGSDNVRYRGGGNFVDYFKVRMRGGKGGNGAVSFDTSIRQRRGRTSGGDGGKGGSVYIMADPSLDSLQHLKAFVRAGNGGHGRSNNRGGANGADVIIKVPFGTTIRETFKDQFQFEPWMDESFEETSETTESTEGAVDLDDNVETYKHSFEEFEEFEEEQRPDTSGGIKTKIAPLETPVWEEIEFNESKMGPILAARGGRGGRGNMAFGHNNHDCEIGQMGEERFLEFDLKTMASVGLVGVPNAGKSSLLTAISNAHPKIASYPFTTINPYVGVIDFADGHRFTVADIPGLIEGAHANRGLGHQFLKHIVKSKILAFVIDFSQPSPWDDFRILQSELDLYQQGLSTKCRLVVANKADLLAPDVLKWKVEEFKNRIHADAFTPLVVPISALHGLAVTKVTSSLRSLLESDSQQMRITE